MFTGCRASSPRACARIWFHVSDAAAETKFASVGAEHDNVGVEAPGPGLRDDRAGPAMLHSLTIAFLSAGVVSRSD